MSEWVIETEGLSKQYRKLEAVRDLTLRVSRGSVYGFLGKNGSGKTTTIKMLLGLLSPSSGTARVLGMDPRKNAVAIRRRVGYVSEDRPLYPWMTIGEVLWFVKGAFPTWSDSLAKAYVKQFELDEGQKIKHLSKGMVGKVWLIAALAHEPELLVLDEPTSGLDPTVRKDFLEGIVDLAGKEGKTVFLSSHNLADVERVADHIGILHEGTLQFSLSMEEIKKSIRQILLSFEGEPPGVALGRGIQSVKRRGRELQFLVTDFREGLMDELKAKYQPASVEVKDLSLEEVFVELVKGEVES